MRPVVTPAEMRAIDSAAPEPVEELIERAGAAVARAALDHLGGTYGRRVVVVAGKGNNGADGRVAAERLERRGVRVLVLDAASAPAVLPPCDVVVDAAYGTGFTGTYAAPDPGDAFVLAVDVPSGVDGLTGVAADGAVRADATVTLAALKPGLLLADGRELSGSVDVVDIGLDVSTATAQLITDADVYAGVPGRRRDAHKYDSAVLVVAGSPGMTGAAQLSSHAAMRAGAGYVRLCVPGADLRELPASEVVGRALPEGDWADAALAEVEKMRAAVVGPGLGRSAATQRSVQRFVAEADLPLVVDGDALPARPDLPERRAVTVLTPHDGEFQRLTGAAPGEDRLAAVRALAADTGTVALLKGSTTVVADPPGRALFVTSGSSRLATAGTGDVLTGVLAAFLAQGLPPLEGAGFAAHVHGAAARRGHVRGLVAGDLLDLVPRWFAGG